MWHGLGSPRQADQAQHRLHAVCATDADLLDRLLDSFEDVFATPTGLPPRRDCDHRIHLPPGTTLVAVRPYRYPQLQKDELEAQCNAMLEQGIIRPSTSPFSTPVLLMRKSDSKW